MKTILDEAFAPITGEVAFVNATLREVGDAVQTWYRGLYGGDWTIAAVDGSLEQHLAAMTPLPRLGYGASRELLIETEGPWTAWFANALPWPDLFSSISHTCSVLERRGVHVRASTRASSLSDPGKRSLEVLTFQLLAEKPTEWLNILRTVELVFTDDRLQFQLSGTQQSFEEPDRYRALRKKNRFDSDMLERYCAALGIRVFDPEFYGPAGLLISKRPSMHRNDTTTLRDAQSELGIVPGTARLMPG